MSVSGVHGWEDIIDEGHYDKAFGMCLDVIRLVLLGKLYLTIK